MRIKTALTLTTLLIFIGVLAATAQPKPQPQPYTPNQNTVTPGSRTISFRTLDGVLNKDLTKANLISLDGSWSVQFFDYEFQADTHAGGNQKAAQDSTILPSVWAANGQAPALYSKAAYPFLTHKPAPGNFQIPQSGKTALYTRTATIPFDFMDKQIYLTVGGGGGKTTLFINGKEVGFSTDSKVSAQYDITKFIKRGLNTIALKVEEFSGASWVEDQSGWRTNGPNRETFIYAQPKIRIRDMINRTQLNNDRTTALLSSALLLKSELINPHTVTVYYELRDHTGKILQKNQKEVNIGKRREDTVRFNTTLQDVRLWTAETPNLYTIIYSVKREGRFTEFAAKRVGVREVKVEGEKLMINGVAPVIKGVNFSEFSPESIAVLDPKTVKAQMVEMKKLGVNALRTNGYPLPAYFYALADSIGFYVVDVANLSTTGLENNINKGRSLANNPEWKEIFTQRIVATYEATKNHASVIGIALGQSAGNGYNMYQARLELQRRNPNLVVFYDHTGFEWNADVVTPLYPTIEELDKISRTYYHQPIIPAKVNLDYRYWHHEKTQGAFVDRWQSESITAPDVKKFQRLEDDYTLTPLIDGKLVQESAEDQKPLLSEIFQNLYVEIIDAKLGTIRITNRMDYRELRDFPATYRTIDPSKVTKWRTIILNCAPGQSQTLTLSPFEGKAIEITAGDFYHKITK